MSKGAKTICVILLLGCAALWFLAPFIQLIGTQFTAFDLVKEAGKAGTLFHIETAHDFLSLCVILGTIVGVVICLISSLAGSRILTGVVGIITEIPLVIYAVSMYNDISKYLGGSDTIKTIFEFYKVGYWGIALLLLIVIITAFAGRKKA